MLKDRVAIVTGSSGGIGRVVAQQLARRGAKVVLLSRASDRLAAALAEVRAFSPASEAFAADVSVPSEVAEAVNKTMAQFGQIDILVNNAGITKDGLIMRMKEEDWQQVMEVNLTSIFRLTQLVLRPMVKARYGRIIQISSVVGSTGNAGQANYVAAKAGLEGFAKTVALEVASRNITVNCVAPGFIRSAMTDQLNSKTREAILARIPLGVAGEPEDVAHAVAFLASAEARYITGQTIHVNGGMYMR
ncbi:MAG: 3-oxoacyl-[acyl-carrier-protein] reductase [Magnetococcales bacterium]|nr:3-oxoacyl-[acyl-carrier-protein] reductase [Magnetococcales bacterium]